MAKRSKILVIALAVVLVIGLAGTGMALAKGRVESGVPGASYAIPNSGLSEKSENADPQMMRRGGMKGGFRGGVGGFGMGMRSINFTRIATFLGITTDELRTQLAGGKSLAVIATEKQKTVKDLVATILAPWKEHQQVNVKYGYISQAEADAMYQLRAVRTEAMISRPFPARTGTSGN